MPEARFEIFEGSGLIITKSVLYPLKASLYLGPWNARKAVDYSDPANKLKAAFAIDTTLTRGAVYKGMPAFVKYPCPKTGQRLSRRIPSEIARELKTAALEVQYLHAFAALQQLHQKGPSTLLASSDSTLNDVFDNWESGKLAEVVVAPTFNRARFEDRAAVEVAF